MTNTKPIPEKKKRSWKRTAVEWGFLLLIIAFFRYTDQGTVVQGWLQQGLLATGIMQADIRYAEEHDQPADYDLTLLTLDGQSVHLSEFEGKVVFINFWATWCAPCLAEMPFIQALYEDVASDDIVFVTIATDEDQEVAERFLERKGYTLPVYRVASSIPPLFDVNTLPATFVISPAGNLATVHVGMANYDTRGFRKFLKDLAKQVSTTTVTEI